MKCENCGETYIGEQKHSKSSFALCLFGLCKKLEKEEDNWNLADKWFQLRSSEAEELVRDKTGVTVFLEKDFKTFIQKVKEDTSAKNSPQQVIVPDGTWDGDSINMGIKLGIKFVTGRLDKRAGDL